MDLITATVTSLGTWNWWILAGVLLVLELLSGTFFFLWLGAAAVVVGLVMLFADWSWQVQLSVYAVLSLIFVAASYLLARRETGEAEPFLNRRAERHFGRVFTLHEPIVDGRGKVRIDDTVWLVTGEDCAAETRVKVVGVDGSMLQVEPAG